MLSLVYDERKKVHSFLFILSGYVKIVPENGPFLAKVFMAVSKTYLLDCDSPLGMQNGDIPNSDITASSEVCN